MSSSVTDRRPPNAGAKVDLGSDAPVAQEGAGVVQTDSLAAESSAFTANRNAQPKKVPTDDLLGASAHQRQQQQDPPPPPQGQGGPAPTYVENQLRRTPGGPHGKNLTEGFDDAGKQEDGIRKAFAAEPGSEDDPARAEVQKLSEQSGGRGAEGSAKGGLSGEGQFDTLKDESA